MPLETQLGDLATRAARALRIVGRIPFRLDEMIVPVAGIVDLDREPYRTEPLTFLAPINPLTHTLPDATLYGLRAVSGVVVVRQLRVYSILGLRFYLRRQADPPTAPTVQRAVAVNRPGGNDPSNISRPSCLVIDTIAAGGAIPAGSVELMPFQFQGFTDNLTLETPIVLFPGDEFFVMDEPGDQGGVAINGWFAAEEYQQL